MAVKHPKFEIYNTFLAMFFKVPEEYFITLLMRTLNIPVIEKY